MLSRILEVTREQLPTNQPDSKIGAAAHSLRAAKPESVAEAAHLEPMAPFHMHVAEQEAEVCEVRESFGDRPVSWLLDNLDIDARWCLIHCTQMNPRESTALAKSGAVAGLCPITESNLGDGIFDGVRFRAAGGTFGIGSDSNVRVSLGEELRTLEYSQRLRDRNRVALAKSKSSAGRVLFRMRLAKAAPRHADAGLAQSARVHGRT